MVVGKHRQRISYCCIRGNATSNNKRADRRLTIEGASRTVDQTIDDCCLKRCCNVMWVIAFRVPCAEHGAF